MSSMCLVSGEGVIDVSLFKKIEDSQGNSKSKKTNKRQKEDQENFLIKCRIGQRPVLWPDSGHSSIHLPGCFYCSLSGYHLHDGTNDWSTPKRGAASSAQPTDLRMRPVGLVEVIIRLRTSPPRLFLPERALIATRRLACSPSSRWGFFCGAGRWGVYWVLFVR